jgi:phospholipid/cholesterol/gamma-HCH transport system substrate-binding protein
METDKHYFTVGMFIIVLTLLATGFAIWLANAGRADDVRYRIYFPESVSGLVEGGPVKFRGVSVGTVESIAIDENDPRLIRVDTRILKSAPVKTDTTASLKLQGITGAIFIELSGGTPGAKLLRKATPKDEIPVIPSSTSGISAVVNQLPAIMEKLEKFTDQMNKLASDENLAALSAILGNTSTISADVGDIVHSSKQDSKQVMVNLRKASRDINQVTDKVKENPSSLLFPPEEEGIPAP